MIAISNIEVRGFSPAIRGMRNPMNSWSKSDSRVIPTSSDEDSYKVGDNDLKLMKVLFESGTDHRKFMRMIIAFMDIEAPLYWWKEFDTYKVGSVRNSCSTMHKVHTRDFRFCDFSFDKMDSNATDALEIIIEKLNTERHLFLKTNDKRHWWNIIQLLPSSYNQKATVMLSYEALANMYFARKEHKLDEWRTFCEVMLNHLPYFEKIIK